jgi:hypothetical protein
LAAAFWVSPVDGDFVVGSWIFRIAAPIAAIVLFIYLVRSAGEPSLRERLAAIPPAADAVCPFCRTALVSGTSSRWSCPDCGVVRY